MISKNAEKYLNRCYKPGNNQLKERVYSREMVDKAIAISEKEIIDKASQEFAKTCEMHGHGGVCLDGGYCTDKCSRISCFVNKIKDGVLY